MAQGFLELMPVWINITLLDLQDARAGKLVEALRTKALAEGQSDPMPRLITTTVTELRDCIAFGGAPVSATAESIPAGLKDAAVQKVIRLMKGRLLQELTKDESSADSLYQKRLEQLTQGRWPVDTPPDPMGTPPIPSAPGYFGGDEKIPL